MARVLIFSDVHGNLEALDAVLDHARTFARPDQVWCLGDLVGYGPDPGACIDRVRNGFDGVPITCILGNHDDGVIQLRLGQSIAESSGVSASIFESWQWTAKTITRDQFAYLQSLPRKYVVNHLPQPVLLVHAAPPDDIESYLLTVRAVEGRLSDFKERLCCFGHTHLPSYFECSRTTLEIRPRLFSASGQRKRLLGESILINPGSVGQPRWGELSDGSMAAPNSDQRVQPYPRELRGVPKATYIWLEFDGEEISATCHYIDYNTTATVNKLKALRTAPKPFDTPQRWLNRLTTGLR